MTSVVPEASTATPDTQDQRATKPTALYRLYGTGGTLLYIGVTDNPDRRFKQHRDSKPWWPQVARKAIEWHPSRARALAEESAAIAAETPTYNIDYNPAAVSYHWPPAGMPADRVDAIEREASTLPADQAEGIRRAAFDGFIRAQLDTEQRITALAGALYVANSTYAAALKMPNPAATLDDICDALPEVMPEILGVIKTTPELTKVLTDDVADRLWAYTVIEYARIEAGDGYGYIFDLMVEALEKGGDPHSIRATALGVPAKIRELAAEAAA